MTNDDKELYLRLNEKYLIFGKRVRGPSGILAIAEYSYETGITPLNRLDTHTIWYANSILFDRIVEQEICDEDQRAQIMFKDMLGCPIHGNQTVLAWPDYGYAGVYQISGKSVHGKDVYIRQGQKFNSADRFMIMGISSKLIDILAHVKMMATAS